MYLFVAIASWEMQYPWLDRRAVGANGRRFGCEDAVEAAIAVLVTTAVLLANGEEAEALVDDWTVSGESDGIVVRWR